MRTFPRAGLVLSGLVLPAVLLSGCAASPGPAPASAGATAAASSTTEASSTPTAGVPRGTSSPSTPTATSGAAPAAAIPTDCTDLIASSPFTDSFGAWPLNDTAVIGAPGTEYSYPAGSTVPTPAASGATVAETLSAATQLRCVWRDPRADITSMTIEIATVDPAIATGYLASLPALGYTCSPTTAGAGAGLACLLTTTDPKYSVDVGSTSFLRGDTYIHISQANVQTPGLLALLESRLWA
ncbi:hypothetical protein B7R54_12705 [Subtercola boreus]|uniref:Uncharacterized protein n=1 Tax=Subtercola boreus TaxID=120213 RepID=A0A3E0VK05_9MICO|nr:hypothetical protein [Subtercola boreus]RFA09965.1 hypothetical protein B7R54_12705 [Subtercola boreus]TQL52891.1 hypothetical protein FB464_0380 [Subtercola boreus]